MDKSTGINWKAFAAQRTNPLALKGLSLDLTDYFKEPLLARSGGTDMITFLKQLEKQTGQKFIPSDANLGANAPIVNVYGNAAEPDFGFERIFDFIDMRQSTSKNWEILDATNGITFEQVKEGQPAKLRKITAAKQSVGFLKFMGGLGFLDDWFRFNQYYLMDQIVSAVRAKYFDTMAQTHYDLITALTGIDQAFNTDDPTTINDACAAIKAAVKGKGYGVGENPVFKIACGPGLKARIAKALAAAYIMPNNNNSASQVVYRIDEVIETGYLPNTHYWVILPGIKFQRAVWDDLNSESQRDALRRAEDITWEGKYNGAIGDTAQIKRCLLA